MNARILFYREDLDMKKKEGKEEDKKQKEEKILNRWHKEEQ